MKFILLLVFIPFLAMAVEGGKAQPTREISIIVTKEGYYPKSLSVFEGEKVKFYVTSTLDEPHCMIVEGPEAPVQFLKDFFLKIMNVKNRYLHKFTCLQSL